MEEKLKKLKNSIKTFYFMQKAYTITAILFLIAQIYILLKGLPNKPTISLFLIIFVVISNICYFIGKTFAIELEILEELTKVKNGQNN